MTAKMQTRSRAIRAPCRWINEASLARATRPRVLPSSLTVAAWLIRVKAPPPSSNFGPLDVNRNQDNGGLQDQRPGVRDAAHVEAGGDDLHDERADDRADDGRAPSGQRRSADDDRRDGVKLYVKPDLLGITRPQSCRLDQPGEARQKAAQGIDNNLRAVDFDASQ